MSSQRSVRNALQATMIWLFAVTMYACDRGGQDPPNVLLIAVDDMADWVGFLGHPDVRTPNMDRLAHQGVAFTNAHAASPICGPSRAAILTGLRPETSGVYTNVGTYIDYVPEAVSLPRYFRDNGYYVMGAGKINHAYTKVVDSNWDEYGPGTGIVGSPFTDEELRVENMDPTITIDRDNLHITLPINRMSNIDRPYNRYSTFDWGPIDVSDEDFPDGKIAQWAVKQLKRTYEQPFLLAVGFYKPHLPWYVPRRYFDLYDPDSISLPPHIQDDLLDISQTGVDYALLPWTAGCHSTVLAHDQWHPAVHAYLATISFVDAQVGKLLRALEEGPHAGNTIVMLFSDHGFHLGEKEHWGKHAAWRNATRVPLIIRPAHGQYGQDVPGVQCSAPVSLLDIYPTLVQLCGLPAKESLEGKSLLPLILDIDAPWENAVLTTVGRGTHCVSSERWRYIRYYDGSEELYDLESDPEEWHNLSNRAGYQAVQAGLRQHIIEDRNLRQFVRWDKWKAVIRSTDEMMLFDIYEPNGISEQHDVSADHPEVVRQIRQYLEEHKISGQHVRILD